MLEIITSSIISTGDPRFSCGEFDALAEQYTERIGYKRKQGVLDFFVRGRWGAVGDAAFEMQVGEIAGPIYLGNDRGFSVIKLLARQPKQWKSHESVRNQVRRDFIQDERARREAAWIKTKRAAARVRIFEPVLAKAFNP